MGPSDKVRHNYMLLDRCRCDLEYYFGFGHGNESENQLYFGSFDEHIRGTIELWKKMPIKPKWLRAKKLIEYKTRGK